MDAKNALSAKKTFFINKKETVKFGKTEKNAYLCSEIVNTT